MNTYEKPLPKPVTISLMGMQMDSESVKISSNAL